MQKTLSALVSACAALLLVLSVLQGKSKEPAEPDLLTRALSAESEGDTARAERLLKESVKTDRRSLPRWTFANYYLRHEDERAWPLLAEALNISLHGGQDVSGIFEAGWQFRPDGPFLLQHLVGPHPDALKTYISFLLNTGRVEALVAPAAIIHEEGLLLRASDALLAAGRIADAKKIWDRAVPPRFDGELLTNSELKLPKPFGFDWRFNSIPESPLTFQDGLRIDFSGRQPTPLELMIETIPVQPGKYSLTWESQARPDPGVFWLATGAASLRAQVHSAEAWRRESTEFEVRTTGAIRLALVAERLPGSSRFEGTFRLRHTSLKAH